MSMLLRNEDLEKKISSYAIKRGGISKNRAMSELIEIGLENTKNAALDLSHLEKAVINQINEVISPALKQIQSNIYNTTLYSISAALLNAQLIADLSDDPELALDSWIRAQKKAIELSNGSNLEALNFSIQKEVINND